MLTPWRLYIASPDALRLEGIFTGDGRFLTVGGGQGLRALAEIERLCPELLVLDAVQPGLDGAEALAWLERMVTPPRVVFLARTAAAGPVPAPDAVCPWPCGESQLLETAFRTAERPLPALAQGREAGRLAAAEALLHRLGVPEKLKGRRYILLAAAALACAPALGASCRDRLYPYVAAQCDAAPAAVERAIRTAVESTWLQGSLAGVQALFGLSVDAEKGKPTNREFLAMLAEHIRRAESRRSLMPENPEKPEKKD